MNSFAADITLLNRAMDIAGVGCWIVDLQEQQIHGSEVALQWYGGDESITPTTLREYAGLIHQDDRDRVVSWFQAVVEGDGLGSLEDFRIRTVTGGWRWIHAKAELFPETSMGGGPRLLVVGRDVTRYHILQSALSESEARWTSLVDEAPVGITVLGPDGQVKFANRMESMNHSESVIGRNIKDDLPLETHGAVESAIGRVLDVGTPASVETYRRGSDGVFRYYENHISPVRDPSAKSVLLISLDVTQQHLVRRRQRKESRRNEILLALRSAKYQSRTPFFQLVSFAAKELTDADEAFLFLGDPTDSYKLVAHSKGEITQDIEVSSGKLMKEVPWAEDSGMGLLGENTQYLMSRGEGAQTPDGGIVVCSSRYSFLPDDKRELETLYSGLWQAIQLREQEVRLEQLFRAVECTPVSISVISLEGELIFGNRKFCTDVGVPEGKPLAVNLFALHSELAEEALIESLLESLRHKGSWNGELPLRRFDGAIITESVSISPVSTNEEASQLFVVVKEDITERKSAQELVFQAQKMETLGQVAAGVAHDFNNLLTSMLAYNEMIQRRAGQPENVVQYAQKVQVAGERASQLVAGLLAAGRRQRLNPVLVDLGEFIAGEVGLLESLARDGFRVGDSYEGAAIRVEIDVTQMGQVLANLVTNARDALVEKGSEVVLSFGVSGSNDQQFAWIRVEDDGPGIPKEIQDRIFEPFFTTKSLGKGTGLGLAMVQGIVHQHRGKLLLDSEVGKGTRVTVILPRC